MPEQPLTDAEIHAFLALDDARTPGEWIDMAGTPFEGEIHSAADFGTIVMMLPDLDDRPHDLAYVAGCTRVAPRMAEELVQRRQAEARMWQDVERIHGKAGDDFAPDDPTVYRQDDPTVYRTDDAPEEVPCPVCGGRGRCSLTRGRLAEVRELTVDDWREVHEFTVRVFMPFVHGIIGKAKARAGEASDGTDL